MQGRVERSRLDLQEVFRGSLNLFRDGVAVRGSSEKSAENEEIERALQELLTHCVASLLYVL
jgi:hypothetical protein